MDVARVLISALLGIPIGWLCLIAADRVPSNASWREPRPAVPFPRGLRTGDGLVYIVTVLVLVLAALRFQQWPVLAVHLALFGLLVALAIIDIEWLRLPNKLVYPGVLAGIGAITLISWFAFDSVEPMQRALVGACTYFGVLFLAHIVYPAGMGFGDVKVAFLLGLFLGWPAPSNIEAIGLAVWGMFVGFMLGSIIGVLVALFRRKSDPYPFGPFLFFGAVVVMLVAPDLIPRGDLLLF